MSTTRPTKGQEPKRRRGHIRVAAILEASAGLFAQKGFEATTMTEIATLSGTATASLYRFFPSKEAVADALLLRHAKRSLDGFADLRARAKGLTASDLAAELVALRLQFQSERLLAIDLADMLGTPAESRDRFRRVAREAMSAILADVEPALPADRIPVMAVTLLHGLKGLGRLPAEPEDLRDRLIAETREMVRAYLAAAMDAVRSA